MRSLRWLPGAVALLGGWLAACGGRTDRGVDVPATADGGEDSGDASDSRAGDGDDEPSAPACSTDIDCPWGQMCIYVVGSCSAIGHCSPPIGDCLVAVGCDGCGTFVSGFCGAHGYSAGPALECSM